MLTGDGIHAAGYRRNQPGRRVRRINLAHGIATTIIHTQNPSGPTKGPTEKVVETVLLRTKKVTGRRSVMAYLSKEN
jgi:hypothetical protein